MSRRICNECGKELKFEGFVIEGGMEYYCSDECLFVNYSEEEWHEDYDEEGDSYWTEFEYDEVDELLDAMDELVEKNYGEKLFEYDRGLIWGIKEDIKDLIIEHTIKDDK